MKRYLISSTNLATILRACFKSSTLYSGLYVLLVAAITFVGCAEKYDDSAIVERLNKLEGTTIKDINGQISAINKTIDDLKAFDSYFESYTNNTIDSIQNVLRDYVDNNLSTTTDWCSATFATLEKYNMTVTDLVLLEQRVSIMDSTYNDTIAVINQKIEQAIFDMRDWVNTCFTNYYDIAQIDAKLAMLYFKMLSSDSIALAGINRLDLSLALLDSRVDNLDSVIAAEIIKVYATYNPEIVRLDSTLKTGIEEIDTKISEISKKISNLDSTTVSRIEQLHNQLESAKTDLTQSYTEAISSAIETNNGVINTKISNEIDAVNTHLNNELSAINLRIASLEGRVSTLEERVNELSKQLGIRFSDNNVSCSPGDIVNIDYTLINATDTTEVYALPSNGYKAKVTKSSKSAGTISVTIPNPIEDGTVLIFVNNGDRTVTKSLNFISGTMSISADAVMAEADGGNISVDLSTDLRYTVKIPVEATWVHYKDITTKSAMRNETINFMIDENVLSVPRSAVVELVNGSGLIIGSVTIRQSCNVLQPNEIWYTSTDGQVITPYNENGFGANIVSNIYGKNKGIITFDDNVKRIGYQAFKEKKHLNSISLPDGVISIGESAFSLCYSLSSVIIPNGVTIIDEYAFSNCQGLSTITIPESVTNIETGSFEYCWGLKTITIPKNVTTIGSSSFEYCDGLTILNIIDGVKEIGASAFRFCRSLESVSIPKSVTNIGNNAFDRCTKLKTIDISHLNVPNWVQTFLECTNLESITLPSSNGYYNNTFANCTNLKKVCIKGYQPCINGDVFKNVALDELTLIVPKGTKRFYENTEVFKDFGTIIEDESLVLNNPEAVDLGLSVKWASFNIGAQVSEQSGLYFAWGELYPKSEYNWSTYKWCGGNINNLTKYNNSANAGLVDNKTDIELSDDVANNFLGDNWRMPTKAEFDELLNNCTWTWTTINGVNGYKVTSDKYGYTDYSIFLPAVGYRNNSGPNFGGEVGNYWSSSLYTSDPNGALGLNFYRDSRYIGRSERTYGSPIRPVCPSESWLSSCTITMSKDSRTLLLNKTFNLEAIVKHNDEVFDAHVNWESDNPSVAIVDANGVVFTKTKGTAHITASYETLSAQCTVVVVENESEIEHEYVDLGLSVKWATFNVGACSPEDFGDYYAWGEIETHYENGYAQSQSPVWLADKSDGYTWITYKYCEGWSNTLTKYNSKTNYGTIDNKSTLEEDDDVAHVKWGGNWRMPTTEEIEELINGCNWLWTTIDGINGFKITSKKDGHSDKTIFIPAAGYRSEEYLSYDINSAGYYWSSSLLVGDPVCSSYLFIIRRDRSRVNETRSHGLTVRPVCP